MNGGNARMLESELKMLDEMLATIDEERVIERVGLEARREALRAELASLPRLPARVSLTFGGQPVEGNRAILAEFGGRAVALFTEAVATVAASLRTELGSAGPLPGGGEHGLRIVGTATGSFGFDLELPPDQPPALPGLPADPNVEAVDTTLALIDQAMVGDEEALSELLSTLHPRAAAKVQDFVRLAVDRHALFTVRFGEKRVAVHDEEAARRVLQALHTEELEQSEIRVEATLTGLLPNARDFECRLESDGAVLRGKIDRGLGEASALKAHLDRPATLSLRETRLRAARPRYVLLAVEARGGHGTGPTAEG